MQDRSALPSTKRRRLELKQERSVTQGALEVLEGLSYQSGRFIQIFLFNLNTVKLLRTLPVIYMDITSLA